MGKRELVLIALFAVVGVVVYQLTAAPPPPDREGFSVARILRNIRREIHGQDYKLEIEREARAEVPPAIVALNLAGWRGQVTVTGEDRADAVAQLTTEVYGPDEPTARADADKVQLMFEAEGTGLNLKLARPEQPRRARTVLRLTMPARLALSLEGPVRADIQHVAQLSLDTRLADITVQDVGGAVRGQHRDADLTVTGAKGIAVDLRRVSARFERIGHDGVTGEYRDGRALLRDVAGKIAIEWQRTDVEIERPAGEMRFTATDGELQVREAAAPIEFQGTRTGLTVLPARPIAINATGSDATVELRLPPSGGVTLDLASEDGRIDAPGGATPATAERSRQLAMPVRGGGPTWMVRTTRGDIIIKN